MTQNGIFLAKKAIFQDSSIISKVLFYALPIHMRKGVVGGGFPPTVSLGRRNKEHSNK